MLLESVISEPGITATVAVNNNGNTNLYIQVERKHTSPDISLLIFKVNQLKYRQDSVQTFAFGH